MDEDYTALLPYTSRLSNLILNLFDDGDLRTFCFHLDINYNLLIGEHMGQKTTSLLQTVLRENKLAQLLALCRQEYPDEPWEQTEAEERAEEERAQGGDTLGMVLPQGKAGQSVERGLEALSELMRLPEAQSAVIAFRTDFEAVVNQIDIMADYKEVHDLLHILEFRCHKTLSQAAQTFPDDNLSIDTIMEAEFTLQQIMQTLGELNQRATFTGNELGWTQDLIRSQTHLTAALDQEDIQGLSRAIWLIGRIVSIQPSQINIRLNAVARTLRLATLVTAMTNIHEALADLNLDEERLDQFVQGAYALDDLKNELDDLIETHDDWQAIVMEFKRIETSLLHDPIELEMSWPDLKLVLESLYDDQQPEWTDTLRDDVERLSEALAGGNPVRVKRFFRRLDRRAGDHFYRVDIDLRRLCEDLRRVGAPLDTILEILN